LDAPNIRVYKLDAHANPVWHYDGVVLGRGANFVQLQAYFNRSDYVAAYHTFRRGDRFIEWFYTDRWYNIFQMHDVDDDRLKGWYCNIARPARLESQAVYAEDLALDVMVYPTGNYVILDEDEFAALRLEPAVHHAALQALETLKGLIFTRQDVFALIKPENR